MRFLRNAYFWMALGSVVIVIGGDILSMRNYHYSPDKEDRAVQQEIEQEREAEGKSTLLPDPYLSGVITAVILGGFWYMTLVRPQVTRNRDRARDPR
jgi:hypothetical protein